MGRVKGRKPPTKKGRAQTAKARETKRRLTQVEHARRLSVVEDLMVLKLSSKAIDSRLSEDWELTPDRVRKYRDEVQTAWMFEAQSTGREARRAELVKMAEMVFTKAMTRRYRRYDSNNVLTVDQEAPNLFAANGALNVLKSLHGLDEATLNIDAGGSIVDLLKLGKKVRDRMPTRDITKTGAIIDVTDRKALPPGPMADADAAE